MKAKSVPTVTSSEEHVRLKIYDGELPLADATTELVRIELTQKNARLRTLNAALVEALRRFVGNDDLLDVEDEELISAIDQGRAALALANKD